VAEVHAQRQVANGDWPALRSEPARWRYLAERLAEDLGRATAAFEREYVFCWLDWDGDNILMDGGIIDYGSVRQFGLYHREYRFDDVERWSTSLPEQRRKARYVVQCFAQIRDFLIEGEKQPLVGYRQDPLLEVFDHAHAQERERRLLQQVGFDPAATRWLQRNARPEIASLERAHRWFERARSSRGQVAASDGITWNAVYSTRDLLRELPGRYRRELKPLPAEEIFSIALSSYATRRDRQLTPHRRRRARELQNAYLALVQSLAGARARSLRRVLRELERRAAVIDRRDRITGDGIDYAAHEILRHPELRAEQVHRLVAGFVAEQDLCPETGRAVHAAFQGAPDVRSIFDAMLKLVDELRHGL
jgi:hypothetical protein